MLGDYKIEIITPEFAEKTNIETETFTNSEDYSIRLAELIIRFLQKKEEMSRYKILCYKNNHITKCITIENLKEK